MLSPRLDEPTTNIVDQEGGGVLAEAYHLSYIGSWKHLPGCNGAETRQNKRTRLR
jgi:hypothetical protein